MKYAIHVLLEVASCSRMCKYTRHNLLRDNNKNVLTGINQCQICEYMNDMWEFEYGINASSKDLTAPL